MLPRVRAAILPADGYYVYKYILFYKECLIHLCIYNWFWFPLYALNYKWNHFEKNVYTIIWLYYFFNIMNTSLLLLQLNSNSINKKVVHFVNQIWVKKNINRAHLRPLDTHHQRGRAHCGARLLYVDCTTYNAYMDGIWTEVGKIFF